MYDSNINALNNLIEQLHRLPGIGRKTAQRLAFFIIKDNKESVNELSNAIYDAKTKIHHCKQCFNLTENEICSICENPQRDNSIICIVEDVVDILAIEKSNEYKGVYHVLGGVISPLTGVSPENLNIDELVERLNDRTINEILLALNPSTEGEATMIYLSRLLKQFDKKITRIASGVPFGAHLEFIDNATIGRAILSRREIDDQS